MVNKLSKKKITLLVVHTPHTTKADADFVRDQINDFKPHVVLPMEPAIKESSFGKMRKRYINFITGTTPIKKVNGFHKLMINNLKKYYSKNPTELRIHFLEGFSEEGRRWLGAFLLQERHLREKANQFFESGQLDRACKWLRFAVKTKADSERARSENIAQHIQKLDNILETYPDLNEKDEIRVITYVSGIRASHILKLLKGKKISSERSTISIKRKINPPFHTFLSYNSAIRSILSGKKVKRDELARSFVEELLEGHLRKNIPSSPKRFFRCRQISERLSYTDIEEISKEIATNKDPLKVLMDFLGEKGIAV